MILVRYKIGFAVLFLMSTGLICILGIVRPKPISSRVQKEKFWADKAHSKKKYSVIIAGDSRVYRGVDPRTTSDELANHSVLNFGFSSAGFNEILFSGIKTRLAQTATEKIIVLGITPYSLTPKAQENQHYLQESKRNPKEVFKRRYINPFLSFFDPIAPTDLFQDIDTIRGYHETFHKDGWVASYKVPSNPKAALDSYKRNFKENQVNQGVLNNLFRQISNWRNEGIKVYAFRVPSTREMEILENSLSGFNEELVRKGVEDSGGLWLAIADKYEYESYDGSHLTETSAVIFSRNLGEQLAQSLRFTN
jgi:hypothetical protein